MAEIQRADGRKTDEVARLEQRIAELERENSRLRAASKGNEDGAGASSLLHALLAVSPVCIGYSTDPDCRHVHVNPALAELLGLSPTAEADPAAAAAAGHPYRVFHNGRELSVDEMPLQRAAREGITIRNFELVLESADGARHNILAYAAPLGTPEAPAGAVAMLTEVTALMQSRDRLAIAEEAGGVGVFDWDMQTGKVVWTEQLERNMGLPPGTFEGTFDGWAKRVRTEDVQRVIQMIERAVADRAPRCEYEFEVVRNDSIRRWFRGNAAFHYAPDGKPLRMIGVNVDITELHDSQARLELAQEAGGIGTFDWNIGTDEVYWTSKTYEQFGLDPSIERLTSKDVFSSIHPDDRERIQRQVSKALEEQASRYELEYRVVLGKGALRHHRARATVFYGSDGKPQRVVGAIVDVSELRLSQSRLEMAQEAASIGLFSVDLRGGRTEFSPEMEKLVGLEPGTYDGTAEMWATNVYPEDAEAIRAKVVSAMERREGTLEWEYRVLLPESQVRWVYGKGSFLYDENNEPVTLVGASLDVTARRRVEEELRRSNADLTEFAYAVSHDLQQPLRMMSVFSQMLWKKYSPSMDKQGQEIIDIIVGGAKRMDALLKGLLTYSRIGYPNQETGLVPLDSVMQEVNAALETKIQENHVRLIVEPLPSVIAHRVHMKQLFQNLIDNAILFRRHDVACEVRVTVSPTPPFWQFSVEDNGIGMEADQTEYIFGIFKRIHGEKHEGTGIGLALCRRIVESYGGRIWAESELGRGSTFRFTLPMAPKHQ
jgi:PAS domain S-box-containing protein